MGWHDRPSWLTAFGTIVGRALGRYWTAESQESGSRASVEFARGFLNSPMIGPTMCSRSWRHLDF